MGSNDEEISPQSLTSAKSEGFGGNASAAATPASPWFGWLRRLAAELHWSFLFAVAAVYGVCQGVGGAFVGVASDYYWKDVQGVQPSVSQFYQGVASIPWIVKPIWGLLTDVVAFAGYRRRPYFVLAGLVGTTSMLTLALQSKLHAFFAVLLLTAQSAGAAIADVTVDAVVAQNSISHPLLASDMQSLLSYSTSIGNLLGFLISGVLIHALGSQTVLGLLSIPSLLVLLSGILLNERKISDFSYNQVFQKLLEACLTMWTALKCPEIWRPCLYMYLSFALSLDIQQGMFYWVTDPTAGPAFSEQFIGVIYSTASVGSFLGVILYQNFLKNTYFRTLLFWSQLLSGVVGMLDLVLVFRVNLRAGIPDSVFVVIDRSVARMIWKLKWLPLLVFSSQICPPGIEGTFFALLMSIDNAGLLTSSWAGGLLLHLLKVTRTDFRNLWAAVLVRNMFRLLPLLLLFLIPKRDDQNSSTLIPSEAAMADDIAEHPKGMHDAVELSFAGNKECSTVYTMASTTEDVSMTEDRTTTENINLERHEHSIELVPLIHGT